MAEMIPFFPRTDAAQAMIISAIESFVSTMDELNWLTNSAINHMREWKGLPELRGMFCTRFQPRDGRRESCSLPGFTAADAEAAYLSRMAEETARNIDQWKKEKLLAPPGEMEPFTMPANAIKPPKPRTLAEVEAEVKAKTGPTRSPEEIDRMARELAAEIERRKQRRKA